MSVLTKDAGTKVVLPPWVELDPTKVQQNAVAGNLQVLPEATKFGEAYNRYTMDQLNKMFGLSSETFRKIGKNIDAQASGEIPTDVADQIARFDAGKALAGGFSYGGMRRNLTARDLGTTSLALKTEGLNSALRWMQGFKNLSYDISPAFLSARERYGMESNERDLSWKYKYLQAQIEAAPDPGVRLLMDAIRNGSMYASGGWKGTYQQRDQPGQGGGWTGYTGSEAGGYDWSDPNQWDSGGSANYFG